VGKKIMTRDRILAATLTALFLVAAFFFFDAIALSASAGGDSVPVETTTTTLQVVETTTTTIDLSFLNTTTTTQTPKPVPQYRNTEPVTVETTTDRWDQLAGCESGGNWATNTGNGFGGGLQFMHQRSYSTWLSYGGGEFAPHPWEASREQQIVIAERVLAGSGWKAWPGCSRRFGWL
jgi:hypothetical protein